tara:strand:- start:3828 stop:4151 length:324 start_codon:yes stop_codon:yes gene_type:complete
MADIPKVIDLDKYRIKLAIEGKPGTPDLDTYPVAYFEAVWGTDAFGWNATIVDMEKLRSGVDAETLPMRPPQTTYEVELLVRHVRALANDICRQHRLNHLVKPGDDL